MKNREKKIEKKITSRTDGQCQKSNVPMSGVQRKKGGEKRQVQEKKNRINNVLKLLKFGKAINLQMQEAQEKKKEE